ncbi:DMT family transporter [Caulobacter sp. RL271]|jgi:drug/metabolite transporter (DMT)-like permease|uniref:DMT family transporter n=1 Tax=Caulobacter segnis TaxID=88688 RepID=A0ABY4ZV71_9CAUL|nr:DMT family transporter [Caulobacter segnis]USQ96294.1 DMT family transporter [Caulobacter segnis]
MTGTSVAAPAVAPVGARRWLVFALTTVVLWGVWGALASVSARHGFPETLVYCVWALTMIVPAVVVMHREKWKLDRDRLSILYGLLIGLTGAGGQMILFYAVTRGPPYLIFPIISLSPLVTILMSLVLLRERTNRWGALGVALALIALPLFDFSPQGFSFAQGAGWFPLALIVMLCWGVQAYFMKLANARMSAESIFFYMMVSGLLVAPAALAMTDFSKPINWGWDGPGLAAAIQVLNAIGALTLVYAFRHGKAIVVAPLTNAGGPLVTAVLSLLIAGVVPGELKLIGLALAFIASALLALAP